MPLCNIVGNLKVLGVNEAATIRITADAAFYDDSTNPDTIYLPSPKTFTIPSTGIVSISVPSSENAGVAYKFEITPASGGYISFSAVVPEVATVELASLMPTPFTTDRAATGALRIAKEMLTNPAVKPYLLDGLAIIRQATAPAVPTALDTLWYNTASGDWFEWEPALNLWVSRIFTVGSVANNVSTSGSFQLYLPKPSYSYFQIRLIDCGFRINQAAPNTSGNEYALQLSRITNAVPPSNLIVMGSTVNSGGQGMPFVGSIALNQSFSPVDVQGFQFGYTKAGNPGVAIIEANLRYRHCFLPAA